MSVGTAWGPQGFPWPTLRARPASPEASKPLPFLLEAPLPSIHPAALVGELCVLLEHDPQREGLVLVLRSGPEAGRGTGLASVSPGAQ